MRALVTGATGFVGHYLVQLLREKGYSVCALYHKEEPKAPVFQQILLHRVDITNRDEIIPVLREFTPDEIYHLAGLAVTVSRSPLEYYHTNFFGTLNLFEAVWETIRQAKILYVGSGAVYGPVPKEKQPIREDTPLAPVNHYAASKAAADMAACAYASQGLHIVRARPFNHTGPGQSPDYVCSRLAQEVARVILGQKEPVVTAGNLDVARDFTDVRDVVRAYWLLLQKGRPGEAYNICSGRAYTVRDIVRILAEGAGVNVRLQSLAELQRSVDIPILVGSWEKIFQDTGWRPEIPFERTLQEILLWWKEKLYEKGKREGLDGQRPNY